MFLKLNLIQLRSAIAPGIYGFDIDVQLSIRYLKMASCQTAMKNGSAFEYEPSFM